MSDAATVRERDDGAWEVVVDTYIVLARFSRGEHTNAIDFCNGYNAGFSRGRLSTRMFPLRRLIGARHA